MGGETARPRQGALSRSAAGARREERGQAVPEGRARGPNLPPTGIRRRSAGRQTPAGRRDRIALDGSHHVSVARAAVVRTANATACGRVNDQAAHLIGVAVDASLGVHNGVGTSNHLDQGPQPRRTVLACTVQAIDDRSTLDVHWVDGDLIRIFSDGGNPIHDVVQASASLMKGGLNIR